MQTLTRDPGQSPKEHMSFVAALASLSKQLTVGFSTKGQLRSDQKDSWRNCCRVCVYVCLYMKSSNQVFFIIIFPWYTTLVHSKLIWIWIKLKLLLCLSGQVWAQHLSGCFLVSPRLFQLCESLEDLLNVNGELRSEGQAIWTLLGGILGQVWLPFLSVHTSPSS